MPLADVLKKVQRIQITANRAVNELFAGQYRSVFRGRGMEFDEVRPYQPGDDVRSIDWNVTARTGDCFIKRFAEERELTVMFLIDVSASGFFGTASQAKLDLAIELTALLMFSALKSNDKVGLLTFCDQVLEFFPARKGKHYVLRLLRQLVDTQAVPRATDLAAPLQFLNRVQKRRAVVFLLSDFLAALPTRELGVTHRRHDLTAIRIIDPRETQLPDVGWALLRDAESGELVEVDTRSRHVRAAFERQAIQREAILNRQLTRLGIDYLSFDTRGEYLAKLRAFFHRRELRR